MRGFLLLVILFSMPPATAWAGGGSQEAGVCPGFAEGPVVIMRDGCFTGVAHFTDAGSLSIRNDGTAQHSYTAVGGSFDTGLLSPGQTAILTGIGPGIYQVYCTLHASPAGDGMAGVLVVGDSTGAEPAAEQSSTGRPTMVRSSVVVAVIGALGGWILAASGIGRRRANRIASSAREPGRWGGNRGR